jgi:hypothetical protein
MTPVKRFHSVIDNPLSVNRVRPPTTIITTTSRKSAIIQPRMAARAPLGRASIPPPTGASGTACLAPTSSKMLRFPAIIRP